MKKIYSFLIGMAALASPALAEAKSVTITVDNPQAVTITEQVWNSDTYQYDYTTLFDPVEEVNVVNYNEGETHSVYIRPKDGYKVTACLLNGQDQMYSGTDCYIYCDDSKDGYVYNITTVDLSEIRTATATFNIDDASKVTLRYGGNSGEVNGLINGENKVKFDPNTEANFQIGSKNYDSPIFSVKLDGTLVNDTYNTWYVNLTDGSVVDIQAQWPDESHTVKINVPADCPDLITAVKNNYDWTDLTGDFSQGVLLKSGTSFYVQVNTQKYNVDKLTVNGKEEPFYGSYSARVRDTDLTLDFEAHPYGTFDITLNVNDAKLMKVYKAGYNDGNPVAVTTGDNTLTYQEMNGSYYYLYIEPESGYVINQFTVRHAGSDTEEDVDNAAVVKPGDAFTVVVGEKVRDQVLNLWIDEDAMPNIAGIKFYYFDYNTPYPYQVTLAEGPFEAGLNTVMYSKVELPFEMEVSTKHPDPIPDGYSPWMPYICINDLSEGQTSKIQFSGDNLNNGDIVRIFNSQPAMNIVTVTVADDTDAADFVITADGQAVADWTEEGSFMPFIGSTISVKWTAPEVEEGFYMTHTCTLDGTPLEETDGVCTFKMEDACTLVLAEQKNVSIANVAVDNNADNAVYNLQGIRVANNANETSTLPAGIYICGGRKVVVK